MATIEKISIALPSDMLAMVRAAVETGDYASSSEVVREALRQWKTWRALQGEALEELRGKWIDGLRSGPSASLDMEATKKTGHPKDPSADAQRTSARGVPRSTPAGASSAMTASVPAILRDVLEAIAVLCRRYSVRCLSVFGSALRKDFDPATSDIDFVVEFAVPPQGSPAHQYFGFKAALEELLNRRVDLVELSAMPESRLRRLIERTQRPVYAEAA